MVQFPPPIRLLHFQIPSKTCQSCWMTFVTLQNDLPRHCTPPYAVAIMASPSSLEALWMPWKMTHAYFFANRSCQRRKTRFSSPETLWMRWKHGQSVLLSRGLTHTDPESVLKLQKGILDYSQGERPILTSFPGGFSATPDQSSKSKKKNMTPESFWMSWTLIHGHSEPKETSRLPTQSGCPGKWPIWSFFASG